ncbi:DUF433 domain-containing protein [Streptomyces sp. bgisy100]|uniref:DUF433 domain-containing protein n=1 Tax=Streptomyces sp. bgisy100 TaxID=3413783 RepID=UPI003D757D13
MIDRCTDGLLTPAETCSYLGIPSSVLACWLADTAAGAPLVHHVAPVRNGQPSVPFIGVAEAHVLRSLDALGLRMSEIREAAAVVRDAFATPFGLVSKRMETEGADILVTPRFATLPEARRAPQGRTSVQDAVADCLRCLSWEADDDFPSSLRLRQYPDSVPVVIDPRFGHGLPVIAANRVPVTAVTDLREAGETVEEIAFGFGMAPEQVDALCRAATLQRDRDRLAELVEWLEAEHGPVTEDERTAALEELADLDAEHLRRAARGPHRGSAL